MDLFEVRHSPLCRECIDRPLDHLLIGEDGRALLPMGTDCPCIASYTTACRLCQMETVTSSTADNAEADDQEDEDLDEDDEDEEEGWQGPAWSSS